MLITLFYTKLSVQKLHSPDFKKMLTTSFNELYISNFMFLNKSKCKAMFLSHKHHILPPVFIENEHIEQISTHKHLGLTITPSLKWDEHIDHLCLRAKMLLGYLCTL